MDLLLVEELKCSVDFVSWLAAQIAIRVQCDIPYKTSRVVHSVRRMHNRREIDILLHLSGAEGATTLLIENKLDSAPQSLQAQSYREEVVLIASRGPRSSAYSVLISPIAYNNSNRSFSDTFDACISYEDVSEYFLVRSARETGEVGMRMRHRYDLMIQAITKARRGYEAVPLDAIEQFNAKYVALIRDEGLALEPGPSMLKPGRPGESKTMIFKDSALPKWPFLPQTRLVHQLREGNANINFYGWGAYFSQLAAIMTMDLADTPYRLVPTVNKRPGGRSGLMLVVDTPPVDNVRGFEEQRQEIVEGARKTACLRRWFIEHRDTVERWAAAVQTLSG